MTTEATVARQRPPQHNSRLRLTLERGDGECIDLGAFPDLKDPVAFAQFIVRLDEAFHRAGNYDHRRIVDEWSPKELDFHITDAPAD